MGCFKYNGKDFSTKSELLNYLKDEIKYSIDSSIDFNANGSAILLVPDMVTKMEVSYNGFTYNLTYNELVLFVKNINGNEFAHTEVSNIFSNESDLGITVKLPAIKRTLTKKAYGLSMEGLTSDTIVEVKSVNNKGEEIDTTIGTVAEMKDYLPLIDDINYSVFSVIESKIPSERELKGYDYKDADGKSIIDTEQAAAMDELVNLKPKSKRKYSNSIVEIYLSENTDLSQDQVNVVIDEYNSKYSNEQLSVGIKVKALTKNISSYLVDLNIKKTELPEKDKSNAYLNRVVNATFNNNVADKRNQIFIMLRHNVIREILYNGYEFIPSEVYGTIPNVTVLDIHKDHTKIDVEGVYSNEGERRSNILNYFISRETKTRRSLKKAPKGKLLADILNPNKSTGNVKNVIDILLEQDYSEYPWLFDFQQKLSENADKVKTIEDLRTALSHYVVKMTNSISAYKVEGYEASLLSIYTRIPSQAKQSTSVGKLADYDNSKYNFVVESLKSFIIKGQDNDGDKLNTMSIELDIFGKPVSFTKYLNSKGGFDGLNTKDIIDFNKNIYDEVRIIIISKLQKSFTNDNDSVGLTKLSRFIELSTKRDDGKLNIDERLELNKLEQFVDKLIKNENVNNIVTDVLTRRTNQAVSFEQNSVLQEELSELNKLKQDYTDGTYVYSAAIKVTHGSFNYKASREFIAKTDARFNKLSNKAIKRFTAAVNNFILSKQIEIHSNPTIAIEKEIKISTDETNRIINAGNLDSNEDATSDENFHFGNKTAGINGVLAQEFAINTGDNEVPRAANAFRMTSYLGEIGTKTEDFSILKLNSTIDLSYSTPVVDSNGDVKYMVNGIFIDSIRAYEEAEAINNNDIVSSHENDINLFNLIKVLKPKTTVKTESDVEYFFEQHKEFNDFTEKLYTTQVFEDLSELMNAAVDNAKLLILEKLGISSNNHQYVLTMIHFGISLRDAIAIINQGDIKSVMKEFTENSNINSKGKSLEALMLNKSKWRSSKNSYAINRSKSRVIDKVKYSVLSKLQLINEAIFNTELKLTSLSYSSSGKNGLTDSFNSGNSTSKVDDVLKGIDESDLGLVVVNEIISSNSNSVDIIPIEEVKGINEDTLNILKAATKPMLVTTLSGNNIFYYDSGSFIKISDADISSFGIGGNVFLYDETDSNAVTIDNFINSVVSTNNTLLNGSTVMTEYYEDQLGRLESSLSEELPVVDSNYNPAYKFLKVISAQQEFALVESIMAFKNGKNNSALDMRNYIYNIERKAIALLKGINEDRLSKEFTIEKFVDDKVYQTKVIQAFHLKKTAINPFYVVSITEELSSYLKKFVSEEKEIRFTSKKQANRKIADESIFKRGYLKQNVFSEFNRAMESMVVNDFFKKTFSDGKKIRLPGVLDADGNTKTYDLSNQIDSVEFLKDFPVFIKSMKDPKKRFGYDVLNPDGSKNRRKLSDNHFLQKINPSSLSNDNFGEALTIIRLDTGLTDDEIATVRISSEELKSHKPEHFKALYFYDLMISNNVFSSNSFATVMKPDFKYSMDKFVSDYDFSKTSDISPLTLVLTRPSLSDYVESNIDLRNGSLKIKSVTIEGEKYNNVPIMRTSALNAYRPFFTKSNISGVIKNGKTLISPMPVLDALLSQGYDIGYKVNVPGNTLSNEYRVISYDSKNIKYNVYNKSLNKVETFTADELKSLNPDFSFDNSSFGPKNIVLEGEKKKNVVLSDSEQKTYFLGNASKKVMGIYDETWDKYKKGDQVGKSFKDKYGDKYIFVYDHKILYKKGLKRQSSSLGKKISTEGLMNKVFFGEVEVKGMKLTSNTEMVIVNVVKVDNYSIPTTKKLNSNVLKEHNVLYKLQKRNIYERPVMIYTSNDIESNAKGISTEGYETHVRTSDRAYILKSKGSFKTPQEALSVLGLSNDKVGLDKLAELLNVTDVKEKSYIYKWLHQTKSETKIKPVVLFDVIPVAKRGHSSTKDELNHAQNLDITDEEVYLTIGKDTKIVLSNAIANISSGSSILNKSISERSFNVKDSSVDEINRRIVVDYENITNNNEGVTLPKISTASLIESSRSMINVFSGNDANIVYVNNIKKSTTKGILSSLTYNLKDAAYNQKGISGFKQLLTDIDSVLGLMESEPDFNIDTYEGGKYSYFTVEARTLEQLTKIKEEIEMHYKSSYDNSTKIGVEQKIFSDAGISSFVALQTAKNVSHLENIPLYIIDNTTGVMYLYDNETGYTKAIPSTPDITGLTVGMYGIYNNAFNHLRLSADISVKGTDPGYMNYSGFIYNKNEDGTEPEIENRYSNRVNVESYFDLFEETSVAGVINYKYQVVEGGRITEKVYSKNDFQQLGSNFEVIEIKTKNGIITALMSDDSNNAYLINDGTNKNFELIRTKDLDSIGEGRLKENKLISFRLKQTGNLINPDLTVSVKQFYAVNKEALLNAQNTNGENTKLAKDVDAIKEFSTTVQEGFEHTYSSFVASVKIGLPTLDDNGNHVYEKKITSAADMVPRVTIGLLDNYFINRRLNVDGVMMSYDEVKSNIILLDKMLRAKKKSYYDNQRKEIDKNQVVINEVTTSFFDEETDTKVYFSMENGSKDEIVKVNDSETMPLTSRELNEDGTTFIKVANHNGIYSKKYLNVAVGNFFKRAQREYNKDKNAKFFINFTDTKEFFNGSTFGNIAKAFAMKLKDPHNYKLVKDGVIKFNDLAAIEINGTDGYTSFSDIDSSKIFKVVGFLGENSVRLPYNLSPTTVELGSNGETIMQLFSKAIGSKEVLTNTVKALDLTDADTAQLELNKLYRAYFKANPKMLSNFRSKLGKNNLFAPKSSVVSAERAIVDIINNANDISFIFNKTIKEDDLSFFDKEKSLFLLTESEELPGVNKEQNNSIPVTSNNGELFKVKYEATKITPFISSESDMIINPLLASYGFTTSSLLELNLKEGETISLVSSTRQDTNFKLQETVDYVPSDVINSGDIIPNKNLNEGNIDKANYVFVLNIKGNTSNNKGIVQSEDLAPYLSAYGNVIKTDINESDIIHIKSSHVGDIQDVSNSDYFDAYVKMQPYLDKMISAKAKIILSGGVTVNEYIKEYLLKNKYMFDRDNQMFIPYDNSKVNEYTDYVTVFKYLNVEKEGNRILAINNNENGKTMLPLMVNDNTNSAVVYTNAYIKNEENHINEEHLVQVKIDTSKYKLKDSVVDSDTKTNILNKILIKSDGSVSVSENTNSIKSILESKVVVYIKVAIALENFGDKLDLSEVDNADKLLFVINDYVKANSDTLEVRNYNNSVFNMIDTDNKLSVPVVQKTNMLMNTSGINEYLRLEGIDTKLLFNEYQILNEISYDVNYFTKTNNRRNILLDNDTLAQIKSEDVTTLDLFIFSLMFNEKTSNVNGKKNPMPSMHLFVENGIDGLDLGNGDYSMFETMSTVYENNLNPVIYGPELKYSYIKENIKPLYFNLKYKNDNLASAINRTNLNNLPFVVSNDIVIFENGSEVDVKNTYLFKLNLSKSILTKVLEKLNIPADNVTEMLTQDVGSNLGMLYSRAYDFNTINTNKVLFRSKSDKGLNVNDLIPGNIISYNSNGIDESGFVYTDGGKTYVLLSSGIVTSVQVENGIYSLIPVNNSNIDYDPSKSKMNIESNYARPDVVGNYNKMFVYNNKTEKTVELTNVEIEVLSDGLAKIGEDMYKFNSVHNAWLLNSSKLPFTFANLQDTTFGYFATQDELNDVSILSLDFGLVARLSDNAILNKDRTITDGKTTYKYNDKTFTYTPMIDGDEVFKFKSNIDNIKINNKTVESIKLDTKQSEKMINRMSDMYPNVNIELYSSNQISSIYGKDKSYRKAFMYNDSVVYNTDKILTTETIIHEFAHIYVKNIKTSNEELFISLIEKAKSETALISEVKSKDPSLSDSDILEEVIVTMIGFNAQEQAGVLIEDKTIWESIVSFFNDIINSIFGVSVEVIDLNASLNDIVKEIGIDIVFNKSDLYTNLTSNEVKILKEDNESLNKEDAIIRKLIGSGNIKLKSDVDYNKVETKNIKCN